MARARKFEAGNRTSAEIDKKNPAGNTSNPANLMVVPYSSPALEPRPFGSQSCGMNRHLSLVTSQESKFKGSGFKGPLPDDFS
jgi:hypothetical protein